MNIDLRHNKAKELLQKGLIPGVIYGHGIEATSVQVSAIEFLKAMRTYGMSKTFSVTCEGKKHIVYIKDAQNAFMDQNNYIHFDLMKVTADEMLQGKIPLHFKGTNSFAGSSHVFKEVEHELEIEYKVGKGISHLDVDVSHMTEDQPILIKDLILPEGIKALGEPDHPVCVLAHARVLTEETETDEETIVYADEEETDE